MDQRATPREVVRDLSIPIIGIACVVGYYFGWDFAIQIIVFGVLAVIVGAMLGKRCWLGVLLIITAVVLFLVFGSPWWGLLALGGFGLGSLGLIPKESKGNDC